VLRIRIPFFVDPDPGKNLNPDLDAGSDLWTWLTAASKMPA
jgi:hypothetical protein